MKLLTKIKEAKGTSDVATHYQKSAKQPIEYMQAIMTHEQFCGFLIGNVIKYRMRAKYKGTESEDMQKANQYAYWLELVKQGRTVNPIKDTLPDDYTYKGVF